MKNIDHQNLDNLQIWTQREMLSAIFAGIVIGIAIVNNLSPDIIQSL